MPQMVEFLFSFLESTPLPSPVGDGQRYVIFIWNKNGKHYGNYSKQIQQSDENRIEVCLENVIKLDLYFYKKAFTMNSVHFNYFWVVFFILLFFLLKATTCSKWLSCSCAELALVVFKKKESASLLFYFNMIGQKQCQLENCCRSSETF